jgi:epoxyqueuosine reductase
MNAAALTRLVREQALSLGFTGVGVAPVGRSVHADFFEEWLARGRHGEMAYMARDPSRRTDPRQVLPSARSILCVSLDYHPWSGEPPVDPGKERALLDHVSVYARNQDYHDIMGPRLRRLLEFARNESGGEVDGRAYVDTGPLLERELAAAAGLGWVGKNTQLLSRRGSWFFLGEILLEAELIPDSPVTDHCGSCTACIDACPTDALAPGYLLDSRRCISYLNIELRGAIPQEQRAELGQHLFGCDICQDVCPWNRKAPPAPNADFAPRDALRSMSLADLLRMPAEEFSRAFHGSPMRRARRRGLARNAAVLLGNQEDRDAVAPLARAVREDAEPLVRGHAAWALGRLGGRAARMELERVHTGDPDSEVRREASRALEDVTAARRSE